MNIAVKSANRGKEAANEWADALLRHNAPAMRDLHAEVAGYERTYQAFYGLEYAEKEYRAYLAGEITIAPSELPVLKAELRWNRGMLHASARHISRLVIREFKTEVISDKATEQAVYLGLQAGRLLALTLDNPPVPPEIEFAVSRTPEHS